MKPYFEPGNTFRQSICKCCMAGNGQDCLLVAACNWPSTSCVPYHRISEFDQGLMHCWQSRPVLGQAAMKRTLAPSTASTLSCRSVVPFKSSHRHANNVSCQVCTSDSTLQNRYRSMSSIAQGYKSYRSFSLTSLHVIVNLRVAAGVVDDREQAVLLLIGQPHIAQSS